MTPDGGAEALQLSSFLMGLLGGLALFLYGMDQLTGAMKSAAGAGLQRLLARLTRNRVKAALAGAVTTAVIQSSSVTTVLIVGFVSAGLMSLSQSIGVIMGANVGTTVTAQIIAFKVTAYALALIAIGFGMMFFKRHERIVQYGAMVMGLGLLFFGMDLMGDAARPLRSYEPFIAAMRQMDSRWFGILIGAGFTALIQSSSAATGVIIVLAAQGFISLEAGIALAFGANIGTCVTALLAAIGKPTEAVRAALVHVIFNVGGVLIWLWLIDELAQLVTWISPKSPELIGVDRLAAETPRQIANAHTVFNIANTLVFIWFVTPLAWIVRKMVPERDTDDVRIKPKYLDDILL
ncbi:MAG: Na/Pi cotransporter family protein, partial [Rhodothermales bacterium]|nr:Na/Pi cotransporter family protein [Rhodothermales bacterium]